MRKTLLVPMAAAMLTTGCSWDMGFGLEGGDWSGFGDGCCPPGITMTHGTTNLLRGDTTHLSTLFFPGFSADSTNWTVGDSAFRVARISAAPRDTMVLVAAGRGSALVTASRGTTIASVVLNAHDSSDVSAVRVVFPHPLTSFRLVYLELPTGAELLVGSKVLGGHNPTWSTNDTTKAVIAMRAGSSFDPRPRAVIVPRAVGQVYLIAAWGALRDSVNLTITP